MTAVLLVGCKIGHSFIFATKGHPRHPQVRGQGSRVSAHVRSGSKGPEMADAPAGYEFAAYLPRLGAPVRIGTYADAQVFVRRWAIRDRDPAVRELARRMERANSSERMNEAMRELRRELAARGMLSAPALVPAARHW
jgi:hypothetical protein